jgi:pyruvate formate lyase activating enzyme
MKIKNFQISSTDYPGKLSVILFSQGCNYKCPSCYNKQFLEEGKNIDEEIFFNYLDSKKGWIDGVVLCGGEPTLQHDLIYFARKIKEKGLAIKLDTNGSDYSVLGELLKENLIDYVAMDVKGPPQIYADLIGKEFIDARDGYEKSIAVVSHFQDYEFRTTIVPVIRNNEEISFMTPAEIGETAKLIYDCTGNNQHKYFLQKFVPRENGLIDSRLEKFSETPAEILEEGRLEAIKYLPNTKIRGQ